MPINCITDSHGCLDCPDIAGNSYVPAIHSVVKGWNSGANSVDMLDGDIHTIFQIGASPGGIILGFKGNRNAQTDITQIEHGLYFTSVNGFSYVTVIESGSIVSGTSSFDALSTFEIRRYNNFVTYFINGSVLHRSSALSYGSKIVNACLYLTGDEVV